MKDLMLNLEAEAITYNQIFGFNVLPLIGKLPVGEWTKWQDNLQTVDDILKMKWDGKITGVAAICGLNYLLCLDLDKVNTEKILEKIIEYLKLPKDYKWIVKTNSGYHIWIIIKDLNDIFKYFGKSFAYKKFYPKEQAALKHAELRVKNCYVALPPSRHPSGDKYYYIYGKPEKLPLEVASTSIIYMLGDLFNQVDRQKIISKKLRWEPDLRYLASAIKNLKKNKLGYEIWRDCCYALASIGEEGRKYFRELSKNNFYLGDDDNVIDRQFDECLKRYDSSKIKINTLFYYAKEFGFKYGLKRDQLSKVMITYPLSVLQFKDNEVIEKIISYGFVRLKEDEMIEVGLSREVTDDEIKVFLDKYKIAFLVPDEIKKNYLGFEQATIDFEMNHGTDAYGLIGLDFLLDCKQGKFSYNELRSYAAVKAILGRSNKMNWITYSRIQYAFIGYKSKKVYDDYNNMEKLICERSLYRYFQKLKKKGFLSVFSYGRSTYYSTYYKQETLQKIVEKRILEKEEKKLVNTDSNFRKIITEKRKALRLKKLNKIS